MKKPRPSPAGPQKIPVRDFSARETSLNHPLKVDSKMREAHILAVGWKSRMTILLICRMQLYVVRGFTPRGAAGQAHQANATIAD